MKKFKGIFPALVTPFDKEGEISPEAVEKLVENCLEKGVSGFYVGGSTGESYLLSVEERRRMLELVMKAVGGRADVIANIGVFSTKQGSSWQSMRNLWGYLPFPPFLLLFSLQHGGICAIL